MARKPLGDREFIALQAMLMALTAFSIDAMLPALPNIAQELSPENPNRAQLVVTSFVLGMGFGTLIAGPISDAFGRKKVIIAGYILFSIGLPLPRLRNRWICCWRRGSSRGLGLRPRASCRWR